MFKKQLIILFSVAPLCIKAQQNLEAGYSWLNFSSQILNNSANNNLKGAQALYLQYALPLGRGVQIAYRSEIGNLQNLGKPFKSYTNSTLAGIGAEIRVPVLSMPIKQSKLQLAGSMGYNFHYIPRIASTDSKSFTSHVSTGAYIQFVNPKLPFAIQFQPTWNQRLNNDFRTHIQYRLGVSFPIAKKSN